MKTGRRQDPDGLRRMPRERDVAIGRVRKRPSMLLEFQGKHYNHRESSHSYHRHDHHDSNSGVKGHKRERYGSSLSKSEISESRSSLYSQSFSSNHTSPLTPHEGSVHMELNNSHDEGDVPIKRPRLLGDMQLDRPSSTGSVMSETVPLAGSAAQDSSPPPPASPTQGLGLSAYLEDIESDEGDLLMVDEDEKPPGVSLPDPAPPQSVASGQLSKDQLLLRMETVDRDIAATERQIAALLKKQAELDGSVHFTPSPFHPSPVPLPSSADDEGAEGEGVSSPPTFTRGRPKSSLLNSVYSENKLKARSAHAVLHHLSPLSLSPSPYALYNQPWEAPGYFNITARHRHIRSQLVQLIQRQRREKHEKDVALCTRYDMFMDDWKKRLERADNSSKRKARDQKNRELFERTFPELKIRREQQERLMRVDQRGYGVVRSELELSQVMCELIEQEEAPARTRRTHALIPAMVVGGPLAFHSSNGLILDPMALYRAAKLTNVWSDDEKALFREKYALYQKNFEAIASFLPCKTIADCVRYYYLSKKNEKFKQMVRKATFKRRKFIKPSELGGLSPHTTARLAMEGKMRSPLLSEVVTPQTPPTTTTPTVTTPTTPLLDEVAKEEPVTPKQSRYGDWTDEDIDSLRSGLRKWGRAWTKIYREVGGRKTATQCMEFFKNFSHDESLGLAQALSDCNSIKSAEKAQRKAASRKPARPTVTVARRRAVVKTKPQQVEAEQEGERMGREGESEAVESASNCETGSAEDESGSESTITDSGPEEASSVPASSSHSSFHRSWKSHTPSASPTHSAQDSSEKGAFDIFISAAEALNNIVPPEVALHDHNYALAPLNSVELQGSSGLSLIAAAAAVVSPTLSRSAGSGRFPAVSPVRAPRGRPPNTQRRGSGGTACKLSPTLLSPAGSSIYVPLTDTTKSSFRSRARSAPSDRPRIQLSRAGPSNLRYSISSKSSSPRPILPPASYTHTKDVQVASGGAPSLKSMIASRPQQGNSSNAAFETLVNVAVAASPAELPKSTSAQPTATLSISFQNASNSAPATPATPGTPSLSDGTYSIDMSQAINILTLAHLAQSPVSTGSSKNPQQLLLAPGVGSQASGILGTIVSQNSHEGGAGKTANPATVNVLIGHLTSGSGSPTLTTAPSEPPVSSRSLHSDPSHQQKPAARTPSSSTSYHSPSPSSAPVSSEDLSNLNLLSSLVAVVAGSQPSSSTLPSHTPTSSAQPDTGNYSFAKPTPTDQPPLPAPSPTSTSGTRSSAFRATNLPAALVSSTSAKTQEKKEMSTRTKAQPSPKLSSLINSEQHLRTSSRVPVANSPSPLDNLPRSVVRSSSLTHTQSSLSTTNSSSSSSSYHTHPPPLSTYPSPSPSISQQSTLLLYTRSLSLPNPSGTEVSSEEEDHLESATRGISELSKLLGTDTRTEPLTSGNNSSSPALYRNSWGDQGPGVAPHRSRNPCAGNASFSAKSDLGNDSSKYLSGLLESHTTHPQKTNNNSSNADLNISHSMSSR